MKLTPFRLAPLLIASGVIACVCLFRCIQPDILERLERLTYDIRVRQAARHAPMAATNLGFVYIDEDSLRAVADGAVGFHFGLLWPRQVYGRLVDELSIQGAQAVAFDIYFGELRGDHPSVQMTGVQFIQSDEFFALQMKHASNVILAVTKEGSVPDLFRTNALAVGDISTDRDSDGILRRVQICRPYTNWHAAFRKLAANPEYAVNLDEARLEPGCVVLPRAAALGDIRIPLDQQGNFDLADLVGDNLPPGLARKTKPFTVERVWHMGVLLAARQLNLDLDAADVDLKHGRITLRGPGVQRVVPVDENGYAFIDWCLPPDDARLTRESIESLLAQNWMRLQGRTDGLTNRWRGKLAVVGSSAITGNNLTDRGATPLARDTILVSKHWNVANSLLTGRFVQRSPLTLDLAIIVLLGVVAALCSWRLPVLAGSIAVGLLAAGYVAVAVVLYQQSRYWIPVILPVIGALLVNYACLVTWRAVFEEAGRRRVRAVLSTIVSPKIANVLLQTEQLSLGGARREITVLFADVRGFTEFTETMQDRAAEFVRKHNLTGPEAEAYFDEQARETIATVNRYLGLLADIVLEHEGVLDKFIGDCVMAFWGAPHPEPRHAVACVRAAIDGQRAIYELNRQRAADNQKRELENAARTAAGLDPLPLLPILLLGTGISTGLATVGMMGSEVKQVVRQGNYTVFGREVNLASRLEALSGRGHIFISEFTFRHLQRDDPALAATCVVQPIARIKGISTPVQVYEVPWRPPDAPPLEASLVAPDSKQEGAGI